MNGTRVQVEQILYAVEGGGNTTVVIRVTWQRKRHRARENGYQRELDIKSEGKVSTRKRAAK